MRRPGRLVRPLLILLAAGVLAAQDQVHRPRLGLVLSGGGARGLAHIGVLQVLEEMRVPVDCVAGTSMGAIIGGLYSYGYSPAELERIVVNADWRYLLQDQPSRTDLSIRRKQEEYEFLVQLRVGVRDGKIALPKGLIQGQNLGLLLDQLTLEAHDLVSFEELPLPFRCVAADIGDGTRVVFERGDLPLAMRASMSLPGIFAPVEADGRLLVDGGIIDNLPVEAARSLGAERLIAIDIGTTVLVVVPAPPQVLLPEPLRAFCGRRDRVDDDQTLLAPRIQFKRFFPLESNRGGRNELLPFVQGGAGFACLEEDNRPGDDEEIGLLLAVGGGLRFRIGDRLTLGSQMLLNFLPGDVLDEGFYFSWEVVQVVFDF
jgi:predicted acylesterase/phospholipase RssA